MAEEIIRTINFIIAILTLIPAGLLFRAEIIQLRNMGKNRKLFPLSIVLLMVFATFILIGVFGFVDYILYLTNNQISYMTFLRQRLFEDIAILITSWSFYVVYWRVIKKGGEKK